MHYKNAAAVLPEELLRELQQYIQAGYLYIPAIEGQRKAWGEKNGTRSDLAERNAKILADHQSGLSLYDLADRYCLSIHAIRKILYQK